MAGLPKLGLALLRSMTEAIVAECRQAAMRMALLLLMWLIAAAIMVAAISTCIVIGVVRIGSGLLGAAREYITSLWLADLAVGTCFLLIPAVTLALIARSLRARR